MCVFQKPLVSYLSISMREIYMTFEKKNFKKYELKKT